MPSHRLGHFFLAPTKDSYYIDLLETDQFLELSTRPFILRERLAHLKPGSRVILDEVQKIPLLLDEVQGLIENKGLLFGLCGSSARKLRRGSVNLLGGRAIGIKLFGFNSSELGHDFELTKLLNRGYLPSFYLSENYGRRQSSYVADYLKEEIFAESLTRNLSLFSRFLEMAALSDCEKISFSSIAREVGVSVKTVQSHYEILVDTLTGSFLPAFAKRAKRRSILGPKFYFHDVGIVNFLAKRKELLAGSMDFGKAFENWVCHELRCYQSYRDNELQLSYWALTTGVEVDFILGDMNTAIEAKASEHITSDHLKGLREIIKDFPYIKHRVIVSLERFPRATEDGILILPFKSFTDSLWSGELTR